MGHHDESLIDKVKNVFGMGDDGHDQDGTDTVRTQDTDDRADGWAGVPEALYDDTSAGTDEDSGLGRNPGPVGSARYENAAGYDDLGGADADAEGGLDSTRDDTVATEYGGAYGSDDTPMPTSAAFDRGEAPPGDASFGTEEVVQDEEGESVERRGTGI